MAHEGKTLAHDGLSLIDEVKTSVLRGPTFVLHGSTLIDGVKTFISHVFTKLACLPSSAPSGHTVADNVPILAYGSPSVVDGKAAVVGALLQSARGTRVEDRSVTPAILCPLRGRFTEAPLQLCPDNARLDAALQQIHSRLLASIRGLGRGPHAHRRV